MTEGLPLILSDTTNSYIYGPGGLPIEQISSGGTVTYVHHDQQGSTRLLTGSTGTVTGKCTYGAYGAPTCEGTTTTPLGYDAQYTSSDTGLLYMRARTYDPTTGQFLTVDPLDVITREPYSYTGDNPVNNVDPTGLLCAFGYCLGFHPVAGLEGGVNFAAGLANAVTSTVTFGNVTIPQPFCGGVLGASYDIGEITAGAEAGAAVGPWLEGGLEAFGAGPALSPIIAGMGSGAAGTLVSKGGQVSAAQLAAGILAGGVGGVTGNVAGSFVYTPSRAATSSVGGLAGSWLVEPLLSP
jgi:RHS repeat-associated protein